MTKDRRLQFRIGSSESDKDETDNEYSSDYSSLSPPISLSSPQQSIGFGLKADAHGVASDVFVNAREVSATYENINVGVNPASAAKSVLETPPAEETRLASAREVSEEADSDESTWVARNIKRRQKRPRNISVNDVNSGAEDYSLPTSPTSPDEALRGATYAEENETKVASAATERPAAEAADTPSAAPARCKRESCRFLEVPPWTMGHQPSDERDQDEEQATLGQDGNAGPESSPLMRTSAFPEERGAAGDDLTLRQSAAAATPCDASPPQQRKPSPRRRTSREPSASSMTGEEEDNPLRPSTPTPKTFLEVGGACDRLPHKKLSWSLPLTDDGPTSGLGSEEAARDVPPPPRSPRHSTERAEGDVTEDAVSISVVPEMTMSDEEFQELYLGNIPAHKRGKGLFLAPVAKKRASSSESDSCYGSFLTPDPSPRKQRSHSEGAKRISLTNQAFVPDETGDSGQKANGVGSTQLDPGQLERKPSRESTDSAFSHRNSSTGSDISFSRTVAAHVRRDSIALFTDKQHSSPLRRLSLYRLAADLEELRQQHNQMTKKEILAKYRIHIFVTIIFIISVLFISLGWFYRDKSEQEALAKQKIFLDPRKRILTLSDGRDEVSVLLGQNIPQWQLPMHCLLLEDGNPNSKECLWKNNAVVRVNYFHDQVEGGTGGVGCYNVSWETLTPSIVPHDCFELGTAEWYGPSNQSAGTWPLQGEFFYVPTPYKMGNSGVFGTTVGMYWLSSSGVGLLLNADEPITLQWNTSRTGYMCVVSNYTGPLYGRTFQGKSPFLNYTICNGPDINQTHLVMKRLVRGTPTADSAPREILNSPMWSAKGLAKTETFTETDIEDFVTKLKSNGMNCSLLMVDGNWQEKHGDLIFDPARFTNLTNMTELTQTVCGLSLEITPYFDYRSVDNFHQGVARNLFVRDDGGEVPGLTRYYPGKAGAMLDVTRSDARTWFSNLVTPLLSSVKARGLRLAYSQDGWLPYRPTFGDPTLSLREVKQRVGDTVAEFKRVLIQEHAVVSKHGSGLVAVPSDVTVKEGRSCLANTIEKALTLGFLGYPFVLADGLSLQAGSGDSPYATRPSRELFTRWMQMAAFFPAFKFSVPPWEYTEDTLHLAQNLSRLHSSLVVSAIFSEEVMKDVSAGLPILRPAWWLDPGNKTVHALHLNDEFLVGNTLLVAPILCEGVTKRSVYVPPGVWNDRLRDILVQGPKVLDDYHVELNEVAYFVRMKVYNEKAR